MKNTIKFSGIIAIVAVVWFSLVVCSCSVEDMGPKDTDGNPFIGVWSVGGEYWQFKTNGTGGKKNTATGMFPNDFSFFIYVDQNDPKTPSERTLVMLNGSGGSMEVKLYTFSIEPMTVGGETMIHATLTEILSKEEMSSSSITLMRVSGAPAPLNLTNPLIGEWSATWTVNASHNWSLKYRTDGTVKTYHHNANHQFENGYALRGNTLVIFGGMRFGYPVGAGLEVTAEISLQGDGTYKVTENEINLPANATTGPAVWTYTKVDNAVWKPAD